jgi:hypothetical protein
MKKYLTEKASGSFPIERPASNNDMYIGDYQYDVYRMMRDLNGGVWEGYQPFTNVMVRKLVTFFPPRLMDASHSGCII